MSKNEEKKYTPILPFDSTYYDNFITYDNCVYRRNAALASEEYIKKESGNVIKYYRCNQAAPVILNNRENTGSTEQG